MYEAVSPTFTEKTGYDVVIAGWLAGYTAAAAIATPVTLRAGAVLTVRPRGEK